MVENDNSDRTGQENVDDSQQCCPSTSGSYSKRKLVVFVIIVAAAGIILARSLMRDSDAVSDDAQQFFAAVQEETKDTSLQPSSQVEPTLWSQELDSLASLNHVAADTDAVYVFLAAEEQQVNQAITREIEAAAKKINSNGSRVCAFKLNKDAPDYAELSKQFSIPCVVAMVKGGGMSAVSGQINEAKLIQAFVTASRASSCGPSSSCSPSSCPPAGPRK